MSLVQKARQYGVKARQYGVAETTRRAVVALARVLKLKPILGKYSAGRYVVRERGPIVDGVMRYIEYLAGVTVGPPHPPVGSAVLLLT
jgi:hypothetical protein